MVGGRSPDVAHEQLCRFEFPERPGALMAFLDKLGGRWNISLFHYRNHGADFGRVLAGFEVPAAEMPAFETFLDALGLPLSARARQRRVRHVPGALIRGNLHPKDQTGAGEKGSNLFLLSCVF